MALTNTLDTSTPADDSVAHPPSQGATRIRELKDAFVERFVQDHYCPASGTTYDNDDCGFHEKVTLRVQTVITEKADAGILYSKDVGGKAELHYKDEDGNEIQLTSAGALNETASPLISTDFILSASSAARAGWTDRTATYLGRYLRIGTTGLTTGGNSTHTHAAGSYTVPAHNHGGSTGSFTANHEADGLGSATATHSHSISSQAAALITGTSAAANNDPLYVDVRMWQKD